MNIKNEIVGNLDGYYHLKLRFHIDYQYAEYKTYFYDITKRSKVITSIKPLIDLFDNNKCFVVEFRDNRLEKIIYCTTDRKRW